MIRTGGGGGTVGSAHDIGQSQSFPCRQIIEVFGAGVEAPINLPGATAAIDHLRLRQAQHVERRGFICT